MENVLNFLQEFNLQTLLGLAVICWYFTRKIKMSIDNLDRDVRDMNIRVARIERTVYGKDIYNHIEEKK